MKIRCDVCEKEEARVFCCADEAVLCADCDWRVHLVNKLASRHKRYTLLPSASKTPSLCDICQEKRALLFCQEDRAILCRDCDLSIHNFNEFTQKHNRYLLTGVELSASTSSYASSPSASSTQDANTNSATKSSQLSAEIPSSTADANVIHGPEEIPAGSITEYLMETIPGWHVDDFLDPAPTPSNGYCKTLDPEQDNAASSASSNSSSSVPHPHLYNSQSMFFDGYGEAEKSGNTRNDWKWSDHAYTVPDIMSPVADHYWHIGHG